MVFGANPVVSYPDANRVQQGLEKAEFLLVMDIFPTPTTELAHVVLPAASFAETEGTFSNSERRVQRVRQAIPPMQGKANWEIIQELSTRLGYPMSYRSGEEIFDEVASLAPSYGGMSFKRLAEKGLCWPCPTPDHPGTAYLHKDRFARGKGLFHAIEFRPAAETPDADYPFWLTTGTIFTQYLTGTMSRRCPDLHRENPEVFVEIHPEDARRLQIESGGGGQGQDAPGRDHGQGLGDRAGQAGGGVHSHALYGERRQPDYQRGAGPGDQDPGIQGVRGTPGKGGVILQAEAAVAAARCTVQPQAAPSGRRLGWRGAEKVPSEKNLGEGQPIRYDMEDNEKAETVRVLRCSPVAAFF